MTIFLSLILSSGIRIADMGLDVRELCRSEVSGYFLQLRSDIEILQGTITKNKEMLAELKATQKAKEKILAGAGYDGPGESSEMDEREISMRFELDSLAEQIKDYATLLSDHEKDLAAKKLALKELDKAREGLFDQTKADDLPEGSYPIKLHYRHSCSKYQQLCPLPPEQAERLQKLSRLLKDPKSCERYANLNRYR